MQSVRSDLVVSGGVMVWGRKSLQLIRYFVEFHSRHISIPQGLTAYSLISEPLNPIRSSPKPATKGLPVAVMLELWLSVLRCQTARGCCTHSWHHPSFRFTYGRTHKKKKWILQSHKDFSNTLFYLMIEFVFSIFFFSKSDIGSSICTSWCSVILYVCKVVSRTSDINTQAWTNTLITSLVFESRLGDAHLCAHLNMHQPLFIHSEHNKLGGDVDVK